MHKVANWQVLWRQKNTVRCHYCGLGLANRWFFRPLLPVVRFGRQTLDVVPHRIKLLLGVGVEIFCDLRRESVLGEFDHLRVDVVPRRINHEAVICVAAQAVTDVREIDTQSDLRILVTARQPATYSRDTGDNPMPYVRTARWSTGRQRRTLFCPQ